MESTDEVDAMHVWIGLPVRRALADDEQGGPYRPPVVPFPLVVPRWSLAR